MSRHAIRDARGRFISVASHDWRSGRCYRCGVDPSWPAGKRACLVAPKHVPTPKPPTAGRCEACGWRCSASPCRVCRQSHADALRVHASHGKGVP